MAHLLAAGCESDADRPNPSMGGGMAAGTAGAPAESGAAGNGAGTRGTIDGPGGAGGEAGSHAGHAGHDSSGAGGVAGAGGYAGMGGGGGGPDVDPACSCVFGEERVCTLPLPLLIIRSGRPSSCTDDVDYVRVATCADGTTRHTWSEGGENTYEIIVSGNGSALYAQASGYVGSLCDAGPDTLFIEAGEAQPASECEVCSVCDLNSGVGGGGGDLEPKPCP